MTIRENSVFTSECACVVRSEVCVCLSFSLLSKQKHSRVYLASFYVYKSFKSITPYVKENIPDILFYKNFIIKL